MSNNNNLGLTMSEDDFKARRSNVDTNGLARIYTSDTHIQLGDMTFYKDDFMKAFEGYLNTGNSKNTPHRFANPVPVGLAGFSLSLFVLSLINVGARHLPSAIGVAGLFFIYSGLVLLIAGIWAIVVDNVWGATLMTSFAGFWFSYGLYLINAWNMISTYADPSEVGSMEGFFLVGWTIFCFIMWILTFRSTWVLCTMMFFVTLTLLLLCAAAFMLGVSETAHAGLTKAGGAVGLITSFIGWYIVYEGIATPENALFVPPVYLMPFAITKKDGDEEKA